MADTDTLADTDTDTDTQVLKTQARYKRTNYKLQNKLEQQVAGSRVVVVVVVVVGCPFFPPTDCDLETEILLTYVFLPN